MSNKQDLWTKQLIAIIHNEWPSMDFISENYSDSSISFLIKKKSIELWITSSNSEFSIGFNDTNNNCTWHTHMSLYGANTIQEQTEELIKQINQILKNEIKITCSSKYGFYISVSNDDEIIEYKTWDEL